MSMCNCAEQNDHRGSACGSGGCSCHDREIKVHMDTIAQTIIDTKKMTRTECAKELAEALGVFDTTSWNTLLAMAKVYRECVFEQQN